MNLKTVIRLLFLMVFFSCTKTETVTIDNHQCNDYNCNKKMAYSLIGTSADFDKENTINFYIGDLSGLDTPASLRNDIYYSFDQWAQTGYKFKEVFSPTLAYIKISTKIAHLDCDFHSGELAHAHSPKTKTQGNICINPNAYWLGVSRKTALMHEIGHTLGLGHSAIKNAVMYPWSNNSDRLHQDDLEGFYSLFDRLSDTLVLEPKGDKIISDAVKENSTIIYSDYEIAMWLLKSFEGLRYKPYWDVSQYSVGWGIRTSDPNEKIDLSEANKRTREEYNLVYNDITSRYPKLERWDRLILACMDYNVGSFGKQLNRAIKSGNKKKIASVMKKYVHDNKGNKLDGLIRRRNKEAQLLLATNIEKQKYALELKNQVILKINKANASNTNALSILTPCIELVDQEKFF